MRWRRSATAAAAAVAAGIFDVEGEQLEIERSFLSQAIHRRSLAELQADRITIMGTAMRCITSEPEPVLHSIALTELL
jgi:hypothetical protein